MQKTCQVNGAGWGAQPLAAPHGREGQLGLNRTAKGESIPTSALTQLLLQRLDAALLRLNRHGSKTISGAADGTDRRSRRGDGGSVRSPWVRLQTRTPVSTSIVCSPPG